MDFETVYTEMFTPLYKYVFWRVRDRELTLDIIQQVFMKVFMKYSDRPATEIYKLLYVSARHEIIDSRKKKKTISLEQELFEIIPDSGYSPEQHAGTLHEQHFVTTLLEHLDADDREIVTLRYIQEKEYAEIANLVDKQESTIRKIVSRSIKKLQEIYTTTYRKKYENNS
jgi:RNA polymerase sigma-70 factor (ECF subfamily)